MRRNACFMILSLMSLLIYGCSGDSGGSGSPLPPQETGTTQPVTGKNVITGVASKGLLAGATVSAYKITAGAKGDLIVKGTSDSKGAYSLDLGAYSGPVMVEVTGGTYVDEATGGSVSLPGGTSLRAVVGSASGAISVAVTPLTELAVQMAGASSLTSTNIATANSTVSSIFRIPDIITIQPVAPTVAAMTAATTTQAQRDYTLALATFSQMAKDTGSTIASTISSVNSNIVSSQLTSTMTTTFQSALSTFVTSNANNTTGITSTSQTGLITVGGKTVTLKLSTTGALSAATVIGGIEAVVNLPQGVALKTDGIFQNTDGTASVGSSVVAPSGNGIGSTLATGYNDKNRTLTVGLINSTGIAVGEFATVHCDVAYSTTIQASSFTLGTVKVFDPLGKTLDLKVQLTVDIS